MEPYSLDIARRRNLERMERAREERLARTVPHPTPGTWGRLVLWVADLLLTAGEGLRERYRPAGESGGWA